MQGGPEQVALRFVGIQEAPTNGAVIEFVFARADGTEVRKRLAHLRRFATHLRERIVADGVPELPRVDDAVSPDDCEALARVASQLLATGALADTDAEWLLFAHSTTIQPGGAWDVSAAPKMRTVTVDITVMGGRALRGGPLDSLWTVGSDPHKYVAVVTHKEQRYCTAIVEELHGNPQWGEEATFVVASSAEWLEVTVFCFGGLMGSPLLVGVVRLPVFAFMRRDDVDEPQPTMHQLVDVRTSSSTDSYVELVVSADCIASRCHLWKRGVAVKRLPLRLETGDVLFFQTKRAAAVATRWLSWSAYDHVGIVIGGKRLRLLESVSGDGVILRDMDLVLDLYLGVSSELAVRRLRARDPSKAKALAERALRVAQEMRGVPYNWSVIDMMSTSTVARPEADKAVWCSQLVVCVLQKLDLMPARYIADNYLPGTLARAPELPADPLVRLSGWNGESTNVERPFVDLARRLTHLWAFPPLAGRMNAPWKTHALHSDVLVTGTDDFGFFVLHDNSTVPSAFVSRRREQ